MDAEDWELIRPMLEENQDHFGIPVERLLTIDGERADPRDVYRVVQPAVHTALQPEEAWVTNHKAWHSP
jgi:hypothetical protein